MALVCLFDLSLWTLRSQRCEQGEKASQSAAASHHRIIGGRESETDRWSKRGTMQQQMQCAVWPAARGKCGEEASFFLSACSRKKHKESHTK